MSKLPAPEDKAYILSWVFPAYTAAPAPHMVQPDTDLLSHQHFSANTRRQQQRSTDKREWAKHQDIRGGYHESYFMTKNLIL